MTNLQLELTVLMPCLNEIQTLECCIQKAHRFMAGAGISGEVLIADNGSTDGSQKTAEAAGARVIQVAQRGYGAALQAGIGAARGRYIIMGDSDDSYDFSDLSMFVDQLRSGADLVMGNRFQGGIATGAMPFLHRYLGNPVLSFIGRLFFRARVGDFHCGLRGFSRDSILRLGLVAPGMEFASEMIAKAALAMLRVEEVPTTLRPDGRGRPPHLRTWRDGWRHLRFLLLCCPRWLFLYPGMAMLLLGLLGFLAFLPDPVPRIPHPGLGIHSMLYMAGAIVLGAQLVQLALLTKWMGVMSGVVPEPIWLRRSQPYLSMEAGLVGGVGMLIAGFLWSLSIVYDWSSTGFGPLEPAQVMRAAIPAVTLMIVGMQAAAGSLFAAALKMCWPSAAGNKNNG